MAHERWVRLALGAVLALLLARVAFGENPWTGGVAERLREGKAVRPIDYARSYGWWIAAGDALLVAGLFATTRRWLAPGPVEEVRALAPPGPAPAGWRLAVAGAMAACALLAAPRLGQSFWDDEEYSVRHFIDGSYRRDESGDVVFARARSRDAFLYTLRGGNNHVPFTLLARASLGAWRALTQPALMFASEPVVRLPALVAGVAAVGAMAVCLRRIGFAGAGLAAAWLLALHPWHLRYASEARGYSLGILLVPLQLLALVRVLHRGTWPRWTAFAATEVVLLWAYPGALAVVLFGNAALALGLALLHGRRPTARPQWARFVVTGLAAAAVWLLLMGANMAMFLFETEWEHSPLHLGFAKNELAYLWAGMPWSAGRSGAHYAELRDVAAVHPLGLGVAAVATALLVAAGAARLLASGGVRALLALALLLPLPLTLLGFWLRESGVYEWYVIFGLPELVLLFAVGLAGAFAWLPAGAARRALSAAGIVLYLVGYAVLTRDARAALRAHSLQPVRESVLLTRPTLDPFDPRNRAIETASWGKAPGYYDPLVRMLERPEQLLALLADADAAGHTLYVNFGRPGLERRRHAGLMELVAREDLFEPLAVLWGAEPRGEIRVYRYRGRPR